MKYFFTLLLISLFFSCGDSGSPIGESSAFISDLKGQIIDNPRSQLDKDKNAILNYAIKKKLNVQATSSGIYYKIINTGKGSSPGLDDYVKAHYIGKRLDGTTFDSSQKTGRPLDFKLRNMIQGWQEVVPLLKTGGKGIFLIPSHLAYGEKGFGRILLPNTPLLFEIELLKVESEELY